jgi:L-alanine-DL-glutamate epimerase-like enolase superfamily enzyme
MPAKIPPLSAAYPKLFENPRRMRNGTMPLNEEPGLGLTLSPAAMAKFGERVL